MKLGMKRLGIALGSLASAAWVGFVAIASEGFTRFRRPWEWVILIVGIPVLFGVVFLVVWTIDWIVAGFRADKKRSLASVRDNPRSKAGSEQSEV